MTIAVNTRFSAAGEPAGPDHFIFECFSQLAGKYPQHHFIYIFDRPFDKKYITAKNITGVITGPKTKNPLLWRYWYNYKVPALLKKNKVTIFVSADGICSLRTKVPQCLIVGDLSFLHSPQFSARNHLFFYKKFTPRFLIKAKSVVTFSQFSKTIIINKFKTNEQKIDVVIPFVNEIFKPIDETVKEFIKEKYTGGKDYFLYAGEIHPGNNLVNLLKAFSFFKKRQKSNMQLLIAGQPGVNYKEFTNGLKTFIFRNDVKLTGLLSREELAQIMAAAYAFVYPSFIEDFVLPPLEAMRCGVPVITGNAGALPEICGDAALYANPSSFNDIAEKMMLLFKDENKKNKLVGEGKIRVQQFNRDKAADLLWRCILKCTDPLN